MWCAIQVASNDGRSLWLTDANSEGLRSIDEFKNAAVFWRREHAQAASDLFLRHAGENGHRLTIVEIAEEMFNQRPGTNAAG